MSANLPLASLMIIAIFGLPGSGKTFFARHLALQIHALHISSDAVRKQLKQMGNYDERSKLTVYQKMLNMMENSVKQGKNVALDATFNKEAIRQKFINTARLLHTRLYFIEIRADEAIIRQRLRKERPDSEAGFEVYLQIKSEFQALREEHLVLYSDKESLDEMLKKALAYLNFAAHGTTGN